MAFSAKSAASSAPPSAFAHHRTASAPNASAKAITRLAAPSAKSSFSSSAVAAAPEPRRAVQPSLLQPRIAVVLEVPRRWHLWLFALRLSSILPAVWWGLPSALRLALRLLPGDAPDVAACALAETALATIWCFASGYLSFFFTDCLMSRWLIHYTPQATLVRLLSINAVNAYVTSTVLSLTGGFDDPRLLLPGWIGIATTLTVCYHITHQKINIRKETSTSINVFSIASYVTMVTLLGYIHLHQPGYPEMPLVTRGHGAWHEVVRLWSQFKVIVELADL